MDVVDLLQKQVKQKMNNDPAHDINHIMRVYNNAQKLCEKENTDKKLVLSATLLHDIVSYPKSDRRSKMSSTKSAEEARKILTKLRYTAEEIQIICDAIRDHSFSKGKTPKTIEGKILQDADRLDAMGAMGIARVFAVSGTERRPFYNTEDPFCKTRIPNDKVWALDHFYRKLLKLESLMNTDSGKMEAKRRTEFMKQYLSELQREI